MTQEQNSDTLLFEDRIEAIKATVKARPPLRCRVGWHRWVVVGRGMNGAYLSACQRCGYARHGTWL